MDGFKKNLVEELGRYKIHRDYSETVESLVKKGILKDGMTYKALLNTFLLHMSKSSKLFKNIMKKKYVFDLTCNIAASSLDEYLSTDQLVQKLEQSFKGRIEYAHVEFRDSQIFIGLKFSSTIYSPLKEYNVPDYVYPYKLLLFEKSIKITDYTFDQLLFDYQIPKDIQKTYLRFMEHLKTLDLPLSITYGELLHSCINISSIFDVFIHLEASSEWPKEQKAIDYAKAAFYCQIYLKSKYRYSVCKEYCVFHYEEFYFKVKILIKADLSAKYKVLMGLESTIKGLAEQLYRKVHIAKTIFARLGLYPLYFDDWFIEMICLLLDNEIVGDAKFIDELLKFDYDLRGCLFSIDSLKLSRNHSTDKLFRVSFRDTIFNYPLPDNNVVEETKAKMPSFRVPSILFNEEFALQTGKLLDPNLSSYSIVLSRKPLQGSLEVIGNHSDTFDLGTPELKEFTGSTVFKMGDFYYNPLSGILYINPKPEIDADLLANVLLLKMSFKFIKICE